MSCRGSSAWWFVLAVLTLALDAHLVDGEDTLRRPFQSPGKPKADVPDWLPLPKQREAPPEVPESGLPGKRFQTIPAPAPGFGPLGGFGRSQKTFKFDIDPKTPLKDLLPEAPKHLAVAPGIFNEDLTKVRELMFGEPLSKDLDADKAMEKIAHIAAKINHVNGKSPDGFMRELRAHRSDLHGLPFLLGEDCRTSAADAGLFAEAVGTIRFSVSIGWAGADSFWRFMPLSLGTVKHTHAPSMPGAAKARPEEAERAMVRASMQMIVPGSNLHTADLPNYLSRFQHIDATRALAKLALFSPEAKVRAAAIAGLKSRASKDYADVLVQGFSYPLPVVAERAAAALAQLKCKDALPGLVAVLDRPDPRLPQRQKIDGKEVSVVRELVRVNHHRNCLLCHAPANTPDVPFGVQGTIPLPGQPFPRTAEYSSMSPSPDIVVRVDTTYLRQDFSMLMRVEARSPWPEMQRFDFLVRTRTLAPEEAAVYETCSEAEAPGQLSPYHAAALHALRELTGRDTEPTAPAWRKLLNLPRK